MKRVNQGKFLIFILVFIMVMMNIFPITASADSVGKIACSDDVYILDEHMTLAQKNDIKAVQEDISDQQNIIQFNNGAMSGTCGAVGNEANVIWVLEQNNQDSHNPTYTLTISGTGAMADFEWDAGESKINAGWGEYRKQITKVNVEEGITYIGALAFRSFTNLSELTLSDTITEIGEYAVYYSSTGSVDGLKLTNIPSKLEKIGLAAFAYSSLVGEITLPITVTEIGKQAFSRTKLTIIRVLSPSVSIGDFAFSINSQTLIAIDLSHVSSLKVGQFITQTNKNTIIYVRSDHIANNLGLNGVSPHILAVAVSNEGSFHNNVHFEDGKLVSPMKEGNIFEGWYDNEDFRGNAVTSAVAGQTYYAKWTGIEPLEIRYSDTKNIKVTGGITDLSGWTSDNPDVVTVDHNGNVTGKNVGTAEISVSGMYQGQRVTFTTTVTVNPMQIIYGPADKTDPTTGLPYLSYVPENGKAPLLSDMLGFYPVKESNGDLPFEADTSAPKINLVPGTDVEYIYESEGQTITTDTLPIRPTTGEDSIRVQFRLRNKNYQFCTMGTEWKSKDTITLFVDVYKEGMKEIKMLIDGKVINMYEEHQHYEYTGEGIVPTDKDLTKLTTENDIIKEFTVHFHAVKENASFVSTHMTGKASELKREEVKKLAPKEIGVYSFVINGSDKDTYSYASRRYEIVKGIPVGKPTVEKVNKEIKLSEVEIKGRMVNAIGKEVEGKYTWNNPETRVEQGREYTWTFTPDDTEHYETVTGESVVWEEGKEPEVPDENIDIEQNEEATPPIEEGVETGDNTPDMIGSVLLMIVAGLGMIYFYKKSYRHHSK
ncbi:MAG: leucine-rich repeat protein [Erysipelotrichales bacterium]|nr:leucine-rich repeat protein [Erysipelotrichales bacterium]